MNLSYKFWLFKPVYNIYCFTKNPKNERILSYLTNIIISFLTFVYKPIIFIFELFMKILHWISELLFSQSGKNASIILKKKTEFYKQSKVLLVLFLIIIASMVILISFCKKYKTLQKKFNKTLSSIKIANYSKSSESFLFRIEIILILQLFLLGIFQYLLLHLIISNLEFRMLFIIIAILIPLYAIGIVFMKHNNRWYTTYGELSSRKFTNLLFLCRFVFTYGYFLFFGNFESYMSKIAIIFFLIGETFFLFDLYNSEKKKNLKILYKTSRDFICKNLTTFYNFLKFYLLKIYNILFKKITFIIYFLILNKIAYFIGHLLVLIGHKIYKIFSWLFYYFIKILPKVKNLIATCATYLFIIAKKLLYFIMKICLLFKKIIIFIIYFLRLNKIANYIKITIVLIAYIIYKIFSWLVYYFIKLLIKVKNLFITCVYYYYLILVKKPLNFIIMIYLFIYRKIKFYILKYPKIFEFLKDFFIKVKSFIYYIYTKIKEDIINKLIVLYREINNDFPRSDQFYMVSIVTE